MLARLCFLLLCLIPALATAGEIEISPLLASNLRNLVAYRVQQGRICIDTGHFEGGLTLTGPRPAISERLVMHALDGDAQIRYQQTSWREQIALQFTRNKRERCWDVELLRRPHGQSPTTFVWLLQREHEPLVLHVKHDKYQAQSLWQLWQQQPAVCREHLLPILNALRPDWNVAEQAAEMNQLQTRLTLANTSANIATWQTWVDQLASDRALVREHAYRELQTARPAVLIFLRKLPAPQLDAEQRLRVQKLLATGQRDEEDTPLSVALELTP